LLIEPLAGHVVFRCRFVSRVNKQICVNENH
jgi:hypothetical protein